MPDRQPIAGTPIRVQRKRTRGWKIPADTVCVTRPGRWGNPFIVSQTYAPGRHIGGGKYYCVPTAEDAAECYRIMMHERPDWIEAAKRELRGKNLACFCAPGAPCHADVLLELANA